MKTVLSIAGSDSSGGAGIQADIKTMTTLGVYAQTVITALTAQNTLGVQGIFPIDPPFVKQQLESVFGDIRPDAVKIGMLATVSVAKVVGACLRDYRPQHVVLDPVMVATSGDALGCKNSISVLLDDIQVPIELIIPNIPEAEVLSGMYIRDKHDMRKAAEAIYSRGACAVLIKGGHRSADADDLLFSEGKEVWLRAKRIETRNTHGTGCTLSSALAAYLAKGYALDMSARLAKQYLTAALQHDPHIGRGVGPLNHIWNMSK